MSPYLRIGELALRSNTSVETLRYYQTQNLLEPTDRSTSGYRLYSPQDEQRLLFILHAKKVGFSLKEIKQLLTLRTDKDKHTCEEVKSYTGIKIGEIEGKIRDLQKMQHAITKLHDACCGGLESAEQCTILSTLDDPNYF
ncbi:MAG: Zn(2+)-responsive transcriptional regulator [Kangiellaceae bacterium]